MATQETIRAPSTYYETANAEYDRIHAFYDQIDNKVGFLVAVIIGVPIATIGFASQLKPDELSYVALGLAVVGLFGFLMAGWKAMQAIRVRDVKLGIPYEEFIQYCREYTDDVMRQWVAAALITSSEFNYTQGLKKAGHLQGILPFLTTEVVFLMAAMGAVLIEKL